MQKTLSVLISLLVFLQISIIIPEKVTAQSSIPDPASHFGFIPGSDNMLFNYEQLIDYLMKPDKVELILYSFNSQFRDPTQSPYKLFFNATFLLPVE